MFSSLKLSNLRGRKPGEVDQLVTPGPPHLDLTSPPSKKPPHPVVTTNRRSHKWSIDRALCPGIGDKRQEDKPKMPSRVEVEHKRQENIDGSSFNHNNEWDTHSYDCTDEEHSSSVTVVSRTMNVSIKRDSSGSLGITLRGGAHHDPALSRPLIITQIKPGGPADREGTIKVGDRLLSVDGHQLSSVTLSEAQARLRATSSPLSMLCIQYDVSLMNSVRAAQGPLLVEIDGPHCHSLGLDLVNTPDNSAVVIGHVKTGSIAERCGALMPGDQILAVNDICVEDTKMTAKDVTQLMWTGNSCVLQILPSSSSSYRGFPQPLYSCPSPSQSSKHSRDVHHSEGHTSPNVAQSPLLKRLQTSSSSIQESGVEANSSGVYRRKSLSVSLNCDAQKRFGIALEPDPKLGVVISAIEPRSPAERCGSLQIGDRVVAINNISPLDISSPQSVESLVQTLSVILTIEFAVAQTVMPTSGVFTVKLANNKAAGLGITISGCSQYRGWMVISHIRPGSVAHRCGTLAPGDRLLSVNSHSLAECSLEQAINILHSTQDIVTLVVQKMSPDECRDEGYSSVHTVEFCRGGGPLGITIAGSEDPQEPIFISGLTADGLAEQSQALRVGDQILAIGSHNLTKEPLSTAIQLLQNATDRVVLCVSRFHSPLNSREDQVQGYSSPEIPSVDSAVESWDSLHEQSPPAILPSLHFYKSESATVRRKQPLQSCDSPVLTCNTHWSGTGLNSTNSLNTVQSDADDTCSSFRLSESVLNDYQLMSQQKIAPPSPPCPLQVNYQHRNNTLPNHRRSSSIGLMRYPDTVQANLVSSPRRCRRGFHLLEDEATNFPLSEDLEMNHPEITFDTFFKRVTGPNRDTAVDHSKNDGHVFQVTLYKDPVYEDYGFSVSDGLYERGVFINCIRRGGPADTCRLLRPYDRILQVNETRTEDLDCCLTVPLVAAAGDTLQLTVCRGHYSNSHPPMHPIELKDNSTPLPWMEEDDQDSQPPPPTPPPPPMKNPTITKTL